jgi:O-antigen/teichoic acid export membrane protein
MDFSLNLFIIIADQFMLFIINMLVARHAGEALFGDFTVATNALLLLSTLITLGMDSIVAYYIPKLYVRQKYEEIFSLTGAMKSFAIPIYVFVFAIGLLVSLAIIALSMATKRLSLFEISHPLFLFLWGTIVISIYTIYIQFFRAVSYMRTAVIMSLLQTMCYFVFSLAIYFYIYPVFFHDDPHYFPHTMLIGFILSYLMMVMVSIFIQRRSRLWRYRNLLVKTHYEWKEKIYGYTVQNLNKYIWLFSKICGLMVAPQAFQADDRALSASNPMF